MHLQAKAPRLRNSSVVVSNMQIVLQHSSHWYCYNLLRVVYLKLDNMSRRMSCNIT
eukprot:m.133395 g.133395  ORF g.133395 m.133395 type:complete len:56 (+) comp17540_c0_seq1:1794-1961(+)